MEKRKIIIGDYDTAAAGWTLAALQVSPPEQKTNFVDKPGGHGTWDLSTVLTDGVPVYHDRTLTARLELSTGDKASRDTIIQTLTHTLSGRSLNIVLPDRAGYHLTGRVQVAKEYSDLAHAAVTVTAVCSPCLYADTEQSKVYKLTSTKMQTTFQNAGALPVVPTVRVYGSGTTISAELTFGETTWTLGAGTYTLPGLVLAPGSNIISNAGTGYFEVKWREAVLE